MGRKGIGYREMNGNKSRTIGRKRNKRRVKHWRCAGTKQSGSEKNPTETPTSTDGTKCRAEVAKPRLKTGRCLGKPRSLFWTTGRGLKTPRRRFVKPRMRKWNSKTPSRCLEKTPVGGFKMILKRASGDCVEGSETQA